MQIANFNYPADKNIARIINEKGLKQMYVAQKAGYTKQEFNDMLNGRKLIKACDILRISVALEVTANDIYAAGNTEKEVV